MASEKPVIVVVPGAWHDPSCFEAVSSRLRAEGYEVAGVNLASNNSASKPLPNFQADVDIIRATVKAAITKGKDVVLVMHSYGSVPSGDAINGLTKQDIDGAGVVHLFYCAAFVLPENFSLHNMLPGGKPLNWFLISDDEMVVNPAVPTERFYHDLDPKVAEAAARDIRPFSNQCFSSKSTYAAWKHVPSTYLFCEKDRAIPLEAQRSMVENSGVQWRTESLNSSHSPFLSMPEETAKAIRRAAGEKV
jgi:pimeloyl-ACP methyl ester carboxylesterase